MFNLKNASIEIRKIAAQAGIKSGNWEPVNAGESADSLVARGNEDAVVARVWNSRKEVEVRARDIVDAHLLR